MSTEPPICLLSQACGIDIIYNKVLILCKGAYELQYITEFDIKATGVRAEEFEREGQKTCGAIFRAHGAEWDAKNVSNNIIRSSLNQF